MVNGDDDDEIHDADCADADDAGDDGDDDDAGDDDGDDDDVDADDVDDGDDEYELKMMMLLLMMRMSMTSYTNKAMVISKSYVSSMCLFHGLGPDELRGYARRRRSARHVRDSRCRRSILGHPCLAHLLGYQDDLAPLAQSSTQ